MLRFTAMVPVLRVTDLPRSIAWYRDHLGFQPVEGQFPSSDHRCLLRRDEAEIMLRLSAGLIARDPRSSAWDVYIRVAGGELIALLDQARRTAPLVRGPEVMPDGEVEFELQDPDGHRVCVAERLTEVRGIPQAVT